MSCPNATGLQGAPRLKVLTPTWTAVSLTMATLQLQWSTSGPKGIITFCVHFNCKPWIAKNYN